MSGLYADKEKALQEPGGKYYDPDRVEGILKSILHRELEEGTINEEELKAIDAKLAEVTRQLLEIIRSDHFKKLIEPDPLVSEIIEAAGLNVITDQLFSDEIWPLVPFIFAIQKRRKRAPKLTEETAPQLLEAIQAEGNLPGNPWAEIVRQAIANKKKAGGFFWEDFLTLPHSSTTDLIEYAGRSDFIIDALADIAKYTAPNGSEIEIRNYGKLAGEIGVSARKIYDISRATLAENNYYNGGRKVNSIDPVVIIPLDKYWTMCGYDVIPKDRTKKEAERVKNRRKDLRETMKKDLENLASIYISGTDKKDKENPTFKGMHIISSFELTGNKMIIRYDIKAAEHLTQTYFMKYPAVALKIDNRRPNTYSLLFKIAEHNSIDRNARGGTENTLSVKTLLEAMPNLQSYDEMVAAAEGAKRGNRNWKARIKKPLESALDDLIELGYLKRWEYRNPKEKKLQALSKEQANALTWAVFSGLVVDYILTDEPEQEERRGRTAERIRAAAEKKEEKEIRIEATRRNKAAAAKKKAEAEAGS